MNESHKAILIDPFTRTVCEVLVDYSQGGLPWVIGTDATDYVRFPLSGTNDRLAVADLAKSWGYGFLLAGQPYYGRGVIFGITEGGDHTEPQALLDPVLTDDVHASLSFFVPKETAS